jgi:hypothetical protein
MDESIFKAACEIIRETCTSMSDSQIAIILGLIVHDKDERELAQQRLKDAAACAALGAGNYRG